MHYYRIGGINIESQIEFPELVEHKGLTDVLVKYGKVPELIDNPTFKGKVFQINNSGQVLFTIEGLARYLIQDDYEITVELIDKANKVDAATYIISFIFGVLSFKKQFYPLHGGGVVHKGKAFLFTGKSGAGKSTTIAGLSQRGFQAFGDDISNLFLDGNAVFVHPCFPRFRLWESSLDLLKTKNSGEYQLRSNCEKFLVPIQGDFSLDVIPVKRIYHLIESPTNEQFFKKLTGKNKLLTFKQNSYAPWMVKEFGLFNAHFDLMQDLINRIEIYEFHRPKDKDNLEAMYAEIIAHFEN